MKLLEKKETPNSRRQQGIYLFRRFSCGAYGRIRVGVRAQQHHEYERRAYFQGQQDDVAEGYHAVLRLACAYAGGGIGYRVVYGRARRSYVNRIFFWRQVEGEREADGAGDNGAPESLYRFFGSVLI